MPQCCVPNCHNSTSDKHGVVKFYNFPWISFEQRQRWIAAIRKVMPADTGTLWTPVPKTSICTAHFVGGKKSNDANSVSYVPTIFPTADQERKQEKTSVPESNACITSTEQDYSQDESQQIEEAEGVNPDKQETIMGGAENNTQNKDPTMETGAAFPPKTNIPMGGRTCTLKGCNSNSSKDRHLTFHRFPTKTANQIPIETGGEIVWRDRLSVWLEKCNIKRKEDITSAYFVCSRHFTMDDYFNSGFAKREKTNRLLKLSAYPTLNLPSTDEEIQITVGNSVSSKEKTKFCKKPKRPAATVTISDSAHIVTPKIPLDPTMESGAAFPPRSNIPLSVRKCTLKGCNSNTVRDRHLIFHRFPTKSVNRILIEIGGEKVWRNRLSVWLENCNIKSKEDLTSTSCVCSRHFTMDDYSKSGYANQEKTKKLLKLTAYPTLNLPSPDEEIQITVGNSVSSTEAPEFCEMPNRPAATATISDSADIITPKRPRVTEHCCTSQDITIKVEQDDTETVTFDGPSNVTDPSHELSNKMDLTHGLSSIKQEPEDQLEIHESMEINEETHQPELNQEEYTELEIKQECIVQDIQIKQEADDDFETYPNVVPPETIFLTEFPLEGTVKMEYSPEQVSENEDDIHIAPVCSLSTPSTSTESTSRVKSPIPGISKEKIFPSCSTCKITFESLTSFLNHVNHECQTLNTGSMWRCEIWQCEFCKNVFDSECGLKSHIEKKHEQRNVPVPIKNTLSNTKIPIFSRAVYEEFYTHLNMYHVKINNEDVDENRMIANSLLIEFIEESNLKGKVHKCVECITQIFSTKEYFSFHFKTTHKCSSNQEFVSCKLCSKCHKDVNKMEEHIKKDHMEYWKHRVDENSLYRCVTCEDKFASCLVTEKNYGPTAERVIDLKHFDVTRLVAVAGKSYFKYNIKQQCDHFSQNYACVLCKPTVHFHTEKELNLHLQSHDDTVFKTCALCCTPCYNINEFYDHVKGGCVDADLNFEHFQIKVSQNKSCTICSNQFENHCSFKIHELVSHASKTFHPQLIDGKYLCPICNVKFSNPMYFFAHCSPYCNLFPEISTTFCEWCSISFQSPIDFKEHSLRQHGEKNCFQCKICDFSLEKKVCFDRHVAKEHNSQLIHCTRCFANVRIKTRLTITHFKNCNTRPIDDERLYSCPICGLRLETYKTLINHIKIDMQLLTNKKFQCKHCFNYFFTEYNLCAHIVNGKCKTCNLHFCGKQKLIEHSTTCGV